MYRRDRLIGGFCRRGTLVTKENAPPWPWHYLTFQAIKK